MEVIHWDAMSKMVTLKCFDGVVPGDGTPSETMGISATITKTLAEYEREFGPLGLDDHPSYTLKPFQVSRTF